MKNCILHITIISLFLTIISCGKEKSAPQDIIPKEKMITVMTEIELTQALIKLKFSIIDTVKGDSLTINKQQLFEDVYTEFNISENQFNKSLTYYCSQPKVLVRMYEEVINQLSEKQVADQ